MTRTLFALTPTYRPVGGVIKIFDYVAHAVDLGWRVVVCCPEPADPPPAVLGVPGLDRLAASDAISFRGDFRFGPTDRDAVFFSWPTHYAAVAQRLGRDFPLDRVMHIVQNVRHANPAFADGYGIRLLARPLTRIVLSHQILAAIRPLVHPRSRTELIPLGHRTEYFARSRSGGLESPVRVGYTTWKTDLGDRVAARLRGDADFEFRGIGGVVGWAQLRELYHWCDVFLSTPSPQEGHYLPGMEAMAAGAIVVTPDVGGNRAYCRFGENCVQVGYDDVDGIVVALRDIRNGTTDVAALRRAGYEELAHHSLDQERERFARLLDAVAT